MADVNLAGVPTMGSASTADEIPQYTRTSATDSSSSRDSRVPSLDTSRPGSVAPVHSGRDFANYASPADRRLLCPDFAQLALREESGGTQGLVEVVQRRAGCEGDHDLLE